MDAVLEPWLRGAGGHLFAALLGALFGSFANVCIVRWPPTDEHPGGRSVVRPGSHCPACGTAIRWYDNLPILSYFILRGRCRSCKAEFSARYLFVEGASALLFAAVFRLEVVVLHPFEAPSLQLFRFAVAAAFVWVLVVIAFIDLDHKLILNRITYPAIPIFYGLATLLPERTWPQGLIGAAVGYGVIRLVADGYHLLTRRRGLGYGDGKLLAIVGAYLGWQAVFVTLFLGSIIGSVIGSAWLLLARARAGKAAGEAEGEVPLRHIEIPFGPFLATAALVYLFVEPWLRVDFAILYS